MEATTRINVLKLLPQATTLEKISDFLKSKGLHFSAPNWDFMVKSRLSGYLDDGSIVLEDLVHILNESEENGKQHIFFYKCDDEKYVQELFDIDHLSELLINNDLLEKFTSPEVLDIPEEPTVSQIRIEEDKLIFKILQKKQFTKIHKESLDGKFLTKVYEIGHERGVNVVKLHKNGILDVCLSLRSGSSKVYQEDMRQILQILSKIINFMKFSNYPIDNAKEYVWNNRDALSSEVRFTNTIVKDDLGFSIDAKADELNNILDNDTITNGISNMLNNDAYVFSQNIYFNSRAPNLPHKHVHVILKGAPNELVIPTVCEKNDYEHVIKRIKELNK